MDRFRKFGVSLALFSAVVAFAAASADAQRRNERLVRDQLRTLNTQIDTFQYSLEDALRSASADQQDLEDAADSVRSLQDKVFAFEEDLDARRENRDSVQAIIVAARDVDGFLRRSPQNRRITGEWGMVRTQIERLAANYGVTPDWTGRISNASRPESYPTGQVRATSQLTGTYRLDPSRSDDLASIVAETGVSESNRADLEGKLLSPQEIAIDVRGDSITFAAAGTAPITFSADGRERTETDAAGRTVRTRAMLRGNDLVLSSLGGETDLNITFTSTDGGRGLKVTRRLTTDYLRQTVFADSIYARTDTVARLGIDTGDRGDTGWSSNDQGDPRLGNATRSGDFIVPANTVVEAMLESLIDTKLSQNNDRFKLTVQSPAEFRGAVIEGYISGVGRSGRVSGRSNITFNFESITLRNGKRYDFAGTLTAVKDQNGKVIKVDNEGTAKSDSQTKETAKRGGVGAGLGALIGVIAGGAKGAAIGAIIGGGAGAGSVIATGREDIQLNRGSLLTIQASAPGNVYPQRDN